MGMIGEETDGSTRVLILPGFDGAAPDLAALDTALARALDDPACAAIVLDLAPDALRGLDDIGALRLVCATMEDAGKPVIAAMSGRIRGDLADLALCAHYRVATPGMTVGWSTIALGVPPRAGASQRLPRLVGARSTLDLLLGGRDVSPPDGLVDMRDDDPRAAATSLAAHGVPPRPTGNRTDRLKDAAAFMADIAAARDRLDVTPPDVAIQIIACVEAALLLPLQAGLEMEIAAFDDCAATPGARALTTLAQAEARAWQVPVAAGAIPRKIRRIAIVGGTRMAADLVLACLDAGIETLLVDLDPKGQAAVLRRLMNDWDTRLTEGTMTEAGRDARLSRLVPETPFEDLEHVDAVWEAARDSGSLKTELWRAIGLLAPPDAMLASAGGTRKIETLASAAGRVGGVVGLHPAGTSHAAPLIELVLPTVSRAECVASALELVAMLGRQVVCCADRAGFVVHRLQSALERRIEALMVAGAEAEAIDQALIAWGFRASPCFAMDAEGLDLVLARRRSIAGRGTPVAAELALLDALVDTGLTGREEGAGLLSWADGQPTGDDAESRAVMNALAETTAIARRGFTRAEIQRAVLAALADAGARMIADGTVARAGDVDVAAVGGIGFPRFRGGPMTAADQAGLIAVERDLALVGGDVTASPLFDDLIKRGRGFTDAD